MTVTDEQKSASYDSGIAELLKAAYLCDLSPLEMSEFKNDFPTFDDWYHLLSIDQKLRVDATPTLRICAHWSAFYSRGGDRTISGEAAVI